MSESAAAFIARKRAEIGDRSKPIRMKDIGRRGIRPWARVAITLMPQSTLPNREILLVERLERLRGEGHAVNRRSTRVGDVEHRIGYFARGQNGRALERWTWGQFCPLIPRPDLDKLLALARRQGTIR